MWNKISDENIFPFKSHCRLYVVSFTDNQRKKNQIFVRHEKSIIITIKALYFHSNWWSDLRSKFLQTLICTLGKFSTQTAGSSWSMNTLSYFYEKISYDKILQQTSVLRRVKITDNVAITLQRLLVSTGHELNFKEILFFCSFMR